MKTHTLTYRRREKGISLIEILIALILSSLLISSAFSILADSSKSLGVQKGLNHINETSRFTLEAVAREIRKAGYRENVLINAKTIYLNDDTYDFDSGQTINGTNRILTIRYQGSGNPADGRILDCLGNPVSNKEIAIIRLQTNISGDLVCERVGQGFQILASAIRLLEFQYGVDNNDDDQVDEYRQNSQRGVTVLSVKVNLDILDAAEQLVNDKPRENLISRNFSQLVSARNNN